MIETGFVLKEYKFDTMFYGTAYTHAEPYNFDRDYVHRVWAEHNISVVISLLGSGYHKKEFYRIPCLHYPIADMGIPMNDVSFKMFLKQCSDYIFKGKNIAIHCYAGIGRTGLVLAELVKICDKVSGKIAIEKVRKVNRHFVQSEEQEQYVIAK